MKWKKWQQFFHSRIQHRENGSDDVPRMKQCEHETRDQILPRMREDARANIAAEDGEKTEERAEDR